MIRDMIARSLFRQLSIVVSFTLMDICKALICTKLLAFYSCSRQQWIGQTRAIIYLIIHILSQKKKKSKRRSLSRINHDVRENSKRIVHHVIAIAARLAGMALVDVCALRWLCATLTAFKVRTCNEREKHQFRFSAEGQ
jgi:hypothetical protein